MCVTAGVCAQCLRIPVTPRYDSGSRTTSLALWLTGAVWMFRYVCVQYVFTRYDHCKRSVAGHRGVACSSSFSFSDFWLFVPGHQTSGHVRLAGHRSTLQFYNYLLCPFLTCLPFFKVCYCSCCFDKMEINYTFLILYQSLQV